MPAPSFPETLAELSSLCQFFINAENALRAGQTVDMAGIDDRVSAVCKIVQDSLPEQQQQYLPEMTALISLLNSTEQVLRGLKADAGESSGDKNAQS